MCGQYLGCPYITSVSYSPWSGFSSLITVGNSWERSDTIIEQLQALRCPLLVLLSAFLLPFQTSQWSDNQMTGDVTFFFSTQFDAPSIWMLICLHI